MRVNINKLKEKIIENNTTQEGLAEQMGINRSTFYRKIKDDGSKFTVYELYQMVEILKLSSEEVVEIFLSEK